MHDNIADCRLQIADYYCRFQWGANSQKYRVQQSKPGGGKPLSDSMYSVPHILIGCRLAPTAACQTVDDDHP